jgi:uncharacterized DUF497 family protein
MRFEWDEAKNRRNLLKHGVRFKTASLTFEDPNALTQRTNRPTRRNVGSLLEPLASEYFLWSSIRALRQKART